MPRFVIVMLVALVSLGGAALILADSALGHGADVALGAIVLIVCSWAMQRAVGVFRVHRLTIPGFWLATYLATLVGPSYFVFVNETSASRYPYIIAVYATLIAVVVGVLLVNLVCRFRRAEVDRYFLAPVMGRREQSPAFSVVSVGLVGCLVVAAIHVSEVKTIPLLYLIQNPGDSWNVALLREDSFKLLDSPLTYLYTWVGSLLLPLVCMISLGFYLLSRRRSWLLLFLSALGSGLLYAGMTVAKAPVATVVLLLLLFVYLYRGGRLTGLTAIGPLLVLLYPFVVVMTAYWETLTVQGALIALFDRMFYLPAQVVFWYFELFAPGSLGGATSQNLAWLMGWNHFDIANYVGLHGLGYKGSVTANAAFIGYLYADFGWIGVLAGATLAGAIMQACQVYLVRRPKTVVSVAIYAYLIVAFWFLHSTGLPIVLLSKGVLFAVLTPALFEVAVSVVQRLTGTRSSWTPARDAARPLHGIRG
jgi:hypothetical protein